ncbi:UNVERIFIED_CONTAM: hypothetical protein FKN15_046147 [Acipenser sinensis]
MLHESRSKSESDKMLDEEEKEIGELTAELTKQEEDKVNLKQDLVSWEVKTHQEEQSNKVQKTQQEKESLLKDIEAMKDNLSKVSESLKESQMQTEKQKQSGKEALEKQEHFNQKVNRGIRRKQSRQLKK